MHTFFRIFYGLLGVALLIAGGVLIFGGLPRTRAVVCQRTENQTINCRSQNTVAGFATRQENLERLRSAEVASAALAGEDGDFTSFQINLNFADKIEILDRLTEADAERLKTKVDDFIAVPNQPSFALGTDWQSWQQIAIGAALISFVLFLVFTAFGTAKKQSGDQPFSEG